MKLIMLQPVGLIVLATAAVTLAQTPCDHLKALSLPKTTIAMAESLPEGPFKAPGLPTPVQVMLRGHCRVAMFLTPSSDSHIEVEVWLPEKWKGKFRAVGVGGGGGSISYGSLASAI